MVREIRVCELAIDVSGSELKPGKYEITVSFILSNNMFIQQLCVCVFVCVRVGHSHIDRVGFQRPVAEMVGVVLQHAVIILPDHVGSCNSVILPHQGPAVSRHTASASEVCACA